MAQHKHTHTPGARGSHQGDLDHIYNTIAAFDHGSVTAPVFVTYIPLGAYTLRQIMIKNIIITKLEFAFFKTKSEHYYVLAQFCLMYMNHSIKTKMKGTD